MKQLYMTTIESTSPSTLTQNPPSPKLTPNSLFEVVKILSSPVNSQPLPLAWPVRVLVDSLVSVLSSFYIVSHLGITKDNAATAGAPTTGQVTIGGLTASAHIDIKTRTTGESSTSCTLSILMFQAVKI